MSVVQLNYDLEIIPLVDETAPFSASRITPPLLRFAWILLALGGGFLLYQGKPQAFAFHWTPYILPSLSGFLGTLTLMVVVGHLKTRTPATHWFFLFLITLAFWAGGETLQRASSTAEAAKFWCETSAFGFVISPTAFALFAFAYMQVEFARYTGYLTFLVISTCYFLLLTFATGTMIANVPQDMILRPWGYVSPLRMFFPVFLVWFEGLYIVPLLLLVQYLRRAQHAIKKRQALLLVIAISIPFLTGSVTDAILPYSGVMVYPLAMLATTFLALITLWAMQSSDLLIISPASIARNILDTMQEAVVVINLHQRVEYRNRRAQDLFSLPHNAFLGSSLTELLGDKSDYVVRRLLGPLRQGKARVTALDKLILEHENERIPVSVTAAPVQDEAGMTAGYALIFTDISDLESSYASLRRQITRIEDQNHQLEQLGHQLQLEKTSVERKVVQRTRQLEEARARLLASIQGLDLGYIMFDHTGAVILVNTAAQQILQVPENAVKTSAEFVQQLGSSSELTEDIERCLVERVPFQIPELALANRYLYVYLSPIVAADATLGMVVLLQDITEIKALERSKDEFFTIASHELRTPLTAIRGYTDLMRSSFGPSVSDPQFHHILDIIEQSSRQLIEIVNHFLDTSRLEQGRLEYNVTDFSFSHLLATILEEYQAIARTKHLELTLEAPRGELLAHADQNRTKQVVSNLVGNALKFTEKGGITLTVRSEKHEVVLTVRDTGFGIEPANQFLLFRKFQQASSSLLTRDTSQGTGLGLYISRRMAEDMHGTLVLLDSQPGQGSTFELRLPYAPIHA